MNEGARLDDIVATVKAPDHLLEKPYLRPVYDEPEFVVRNLWRLYGGWYDGNPARLKPPTDAAIAAEMASLAGGAASWPSAAAELADAGRPPPRRPPRRAGRPGRARRRRRAPGPRRGLRPARRRGAQHDVARASSAGPSGRARPRPGTRRCPFSVLTPIAQDRRAMVRRVMRWRCRSRRSASVSSLTAPPASACSCVGFNDDEALRGFSGRVRR